MNANDVSIIIRVNDTDAQKFAKVAAHARQLGTAVDATSADLAQLDAAQRTAARSAAQLSAAERRATEAFIRDAEARRAAALRTASVTGQAAVRPFGGAAAGAAAVAATGALPLGGFAAAGSAVYASRTAIEFERAEQAIAAVTGSLAEAQRIMAANEEQARRLGVSVLSLQPLYARFEAASKGTNLEGEKARDIFYAVAEAAQRLSLSGEDTEGSLRAIEQMMSKGKIQAEELRGQLGDRLPGAFNIMARAAGVSTGELDKMLKNGEVIADDMLPKFAAELRKTFGTDANTRIETTTASFQRLMNEIRQTAAEAGQRLNPRLADISEWMANFAAFSRENPGAIPAALFGRGAQGFDQIDAAIQRFAEMREHTEATRKEIEQIVFNSGALAERAMKPAGASDFYGPGTPYVPEAIDLTAGVTAPDEKRMQSLQRELALMDKKTEYARTLWLYTEGELKNANHVERALALQVAQQRDAAAAAEAAARATSSRADAIDRVAERDMRQALAREEADRAQIRAAMTRNALLDEELRTGERITQGRRALIELEVQRAAIGERTLEQELQNADATERAIRARNAEMSRSTERTTDEMSVYAERAAQNMQDAFADFLFDPFDRGIRGMLQDFTTILQRMAAQAAAARIFEALTSGGGGAGVGGALGGFLGGLFGGGGGDAGGAPGAKSAQVADAGIAAAAERVAAAKNAAVLPGVMGPPSATGGALSSGALADLAKGGPLSVNAAVNVQAVLQVNITNNSGNRLEVQHASIEQTIQGSVINMVVRDINEGGATSRAIQRNFGLRNAPAVGY
jgi:tape measure domain-containing protein